MQQKKHVEEDSESQTIIRTPSPQKIVPSKTTEVLTTDNTPRNFGCEAEQQARQFKIEEDNRVETLPEFQSPVMVETTPQKLADVK